MQNYLERRRRCFAEHKLLFTVRKVAGAVGKNEKGK